MRHDLAMTYEGAVRIASRKGPWMVQYLRARRTGDRLKAWYRSKHFAARRASGGME
jgi:hypothetical protein